MFECSCLIADIDLEGFHTRSFEGEFVDYLQSCNTVGKRFKPLVYPSIPDAMRFRP